jgi:hypothetical protein
MEMKDYQAYTENIAELMKSIPEHHILGGHSGSSHSKNGFFGQ